MTASPFGRQPLALAGMLLAFVVAIVATAVLTGGDRSSRHQVVTVTPPSAPAAVVGTTPPRPALAAGELREARSTGRRFLASYLPVLYGRQPTRTIVAVSSHVKAELSAAVRTRRAPRNRRPHVTKLNLHVQSSTTVVAIAVTADNVTKPYQIVFQLSHDRHGWLVTQLANY